jgi:hypothetical protein
MINSSPIPHHVFEGYRRNDNNVPDDSGSGVTCWLGDRGKVTSQNLDQLRSNDHGYLVGSRRRTGGVFDYI